ncbi:MFS transporter [Streptomyces bobili]|uniref:MFS transporter n=1 Tax=Streptomyces bobili TaxID=67280 RepID=UPI003414B581
MRHRAEHDDTTRGTSRTHRGDVLRTAGLAVFTAAGPIEVTFYRRPDWPSSPPPVPPAPACGPWSPSAAAAALTPASLGLLLAATPAPHRARAVRIWSASGALPAATGPALGGLLEYSWRWVYLINIPVGTLALLTSTRRLPSVRSAPAAGVLPDALGSIVLAASVGVLALTLVKGPQWGWSSANTLPGFLLSAAGAGVFRERNTRPAVPLIAPSVLRTKAFAWSSVTGVLCNVTFGANLLAMILWMREVWGYSVVRTGLAVAPGRSWPLSLQPSPATWHGICPAEPWPPSAVHSLRCRVRGWRCTPGPILQRH